MAHGGTVEGMEINETRVYPEGGARNSQVGIQEVTSHKNLGKTHKETGYWNSGGFKNARKRYS